jgi:hypothetical protein
MRSYQRPPRPRRGHPGDQPATGTGVTLKRSKLAIAARYDAQTSNGSSHGFLVAAIFGIVAVIAAVGLINVRKADVAQASGLVLAAA